MREEESSILHKDERINQIEITILMRSTVVYRILERYVYFFTPTKWLILWGVK